jgi:hypothetical protein
MARKKKNRDQVASSSMGSGSGRRNMSIGIDEAENGFTVNVSGETKDGYHSKKFVAPNERGAIRIATQHIAGMGKGKEKKGKKKGKGKIALSKKG